MKIRFWNLRDDELLEVWEEEGHITRDIMKAVYQSCYQYYEDGFDAPIRIELEPADGSDPYVLRASQTYMVDDMLHCHPASVRFWNASGSFCCIRKMALM